MSSPSAACGRGEAHDLEAERDQLLGRVAELESKLRAVSAERDQVVRKEKEAVAQNSDRESKLAAACDDRNTLVKYCGKMYETAHQQVECEARVAELLDEALFTPTLVKEECPICFLPQPLPRMGLTRFKACCGKKICNGCSLSINDEHRAAPPCPFCRAPAPTSDEEIVDRLNKRIAAKDAEALYHLGAAYRYGDLGLPQDLDKAVKLLMQGAELGSMDCHYALSLEYHLGDRVKTDLDKVKHHFQIAAMGGHVVARYNLGAFEVNEGRMDRAMKHFMIAASAGCEHSMYEVRNGYKGGLVVKDVLLATMSAHKDSQDAMKSDQRDRAARRKGEC